MPSKSFWLGMAMGAADARRARATVQPSSATGIPTSLLLGAEIPSFTEQQRLSELPYQMVWHDGHAPFVLIQELEPLWIRWIAERRGQPPESGYALLTPTPLRYADWDGDKQMLRMPVILAMSREPWTRERRLQYFRLLAGRFVQPGWRGSLSLVRFGDFPSPRGYALTVLWAMWTEDKGFRWAPAYFDGEVIPEPGEAWLQRRMHLGMASIDNEDDPVLLRVTKNRWGLQWLERATQ